MTFNAIESSGDVVDNACMGCDVINSNVINQYQQSKFPDSPSRIEFPSTAFLLGFPCPMYEKTLSHPRG